MFGTAIVGIRNYRIRHQPTGSATLTVLAICGISAGLGGYQTVAMVFQVASLALMYILIRGHIAWIKERTGG